MQENTVENYSEWKEYPERDTRGTIWYPPDLDRVDTDEIWKKKEIGFYIHIPFCKAICQYCPYNRYYWKEEQAKEYVEALKKEISLIAEKPYIKDSVITAGYFGGGTPTTLSLEQLSDIMSYMREKLDIRDGIEITVEANPSTLTKEMAEGLKEIGVTRISIGVQSFHPEILKAMGCGHTVEQALKAIENAQSAGFDVVNIDLLYNIPGQTLEDWKEDIDKVLELGLESVSPMCMFIDSNSKLFEKYYGDNNIPRQREELEKAMYEYARETLSKNGFHMYTLYDFAKEGKECEHHKLNWKAPQGEYIGLGAGAISCIHNSVCVNEASLETYRELVEQDKLPVAFGKILTKEDAMSRFMVFGIYCLEVQKDQFKKTFGVEMEKVFGDIIEKLEAYGLINNTKEKISLTDKGMFYLYNVSSAFYQEEYKYYPEEIKDQVQPKVN